MHFEKPLQQKVVFEAIVDLIGGGKAARCATAPDWLAAIATSAML